MGRIDEAILTLQGIEDGTERALQLAGLISTLFKLNGVALGVTGQLAFAGYANAASAQPELELAPFAGKLTPRLLLDVMRGQLQGKCVSLYHWKVADIPVRFHQEVAIACRELCRDFTTDHGVVKLLPAEEITADLILASAYPVPNAETEMLARQLMINGLTEAFHMDWTALHKLCHLPEYRVGEELAQMRMAAKKDADAIGTAPDAIEEVAPASPEEPAPLESKASAPPSGSEKAIDSILDVGTSSPS